MQQSVRMMLSDHFGEEGRRTAYPRRAQCCHPEFKEADQTNIECLPINVPIPGVPLCIELPFDKAVISKLQAMAIQLAAKVCPLLIRYGIDHHSSSMMAARYTLDALGSSICCMFPSSVSVIRRKGMIRHQRPATLSLCHLRSSPSDNYLIVMDCLRQLKFWRPRRCGLSPLFVRELK